MHPLELQRRIAMSDEDLKNSFGKEYADAFIEKYSEERAFLRNN